MDDDTRVLRADDPAVTALLDGGWEVLAESWGARLRLPDGPDLAPYRQLLDAALAQGYEVAEVPDAELVDVVTLEAGTAEDYPHGPATEPPSRSVTELAGSGLRCFGASRDGELVAVTVVGRRAGRVETDTTSVRADHRRRGLAVAVKAASVIAHAEAGERVFGTGGATVNAAGLAMNARLGYVVEERWLSPRRGTPIRPTPGAERRGGEE